MEMLQNKTQHNILLLPQPDKKVKDPHHMAVHLANANVVQIIGNKTSVKKRDNQENHIQTAKVKMFPKSQSKQRKIV